MTMEKQIKINNRAIHDHEYRNIKTIVSQRKAENK